MVGSLITKNSYKIVRRETRLRLVFGEKDLVLGGPDSSVPGWWKR